MKPRDEKSTGGWILAIAVIVAVVVLAAFLMIASGHSTGDSGEGKASAVIVSLLGTKSALAAGPPPAPPVYPGVSVDGGSGEGVAEGAPPPEEIPVDDSTDNAEVNDNGSVITQAPEPASSPIAPKPNPAETVTKVTEQPATPSQPQPPRAGYCDAQGKFYELVVDQYKTDPYWSAKGPWKDAYTDPDTGAISCDFPPKPPEASGNQPATTATTVSKPAEKPYGPVRTGYITVQTPGYSGGSISFRVNIYQSPKNGTKVSQQRRVRNNETITFKLPPGATSKVKFNGAKCAGWYLKGSTPSSLHWVYQAIREAVSDDPKCMHYLSSTPQQS